MAELKNGKIVKVAGPVVTAEGMIGARMYDVVCVGKDNLIGGIVGLHGDRANVQVDKNTVGIGPGEEVINTGAPLSLELGPGLISSIYDGIQRPLDELYACVLALVAVTVPFEMLKSNWSGPHQEKNPVLVRVVFVDPVVIGWVICCVSPRSL